MFPNQKIIYVSVLVIFLSFNCVKNNENTFNNHYLGQPPPGKQPVVFAPELSTEQIRLHGFPTFSPEGKEMYFPVIPPAIMRAVYRDSMWTSPETAFFSERNSQAPCFSPDGVRIYYQVSRNGGLGSLDIWYVERKEAGWSEPINVGAPVNSEKLESQPSVTIDGTIYFTGHLEGAGYDRGIYLSRLDHGEYLPPELLSEKINSKFIDMYPYIVSDERYLLFCSSRPSMKEGDLRMYVSFKEAGNNWSEPINLNEKLGLDKKCTFPYVSPDSKYLFFIADGKYYWVSAKIIDELQSE